MQRLFIALILATLAAGALAAENNGLPLLFEDNFQQGADRWQPTDPKAWRVADAENGKAFEQYRNSTYKPPFRSPYNIALVKDLLVTDFIFTTKVKSTCRDYPHQDMCLFFGYQDPSHFYYVHLGKRADPHSNQIMIVKDAPRTKITKQESPGTPWDKNWHEVKIVRRTADGTIEVYFDNMDKPALTAEDKTFSWGQVGVGSFDDTGQWADVKLWGMKKP